MTPEVAVAVAIVAAIGAILAAIVAGVSAVLSSRATAANQRILELEKRLATNRLEVFRPMLDMLAEVFDASATGVSDDTRNKRMMPVLKSFATWVQIYGSDEAVRVFHRFMQATYHGAPPIVFMRLYGQFLLAARSDLGDAKTAITTTDLLGIRIRDIYGTMADDLRLSDAEFYRKVGWSPPWS